MIAKEIDVLQRKLPLNSLADVNKGQSRKETFI